MYVVCSFVFAYGTHLNHVYFTSSDDSTVNIKIVEKSAANILTPVKKVRKKTKFIHIHSCREYLFSCSSLVLLLVAKYTRALSGVRATVFKH
jgi:hypothetical protein